MAINGLSTDTGPGKYGFLRQRGLVKTAGILSGQKKGALGRLSRPHCLIFLLTAISSSFIASTWESCALHALRLRATDVGWR
jgi:hypothetical protein